MATLFEGGGPQKTKQSKNKGRGSIQRSGTTLNIYYMKQKKGRGPKTRPGPKTKIKGAKKNLKSVDHTKFIFHTRANYQAKSIFKIYSK